MTLSQAEPLAYLLLISSTEEKTSVMGSFLTR